VRKAPIKVGLGFDLEVPLGFPKRLRDKFLVPPFAGLDAKAGYWQARKRAWLALGLKGELGRGEDSSPSGSPRPAARLGKDGRTRRGDGAGKRLTWVPGDREYDALDDTSRRILGSQSGTSVFDPVLCELAYLWFCPPGGSVLDPFAGGSVRGVVAVAMGRSYTGVDLSEGQIEADRAQWEEICPVLGPDAVRPTWLVGDSQTVGDMLGEGASEFDFVFTCPPYADLERYSDDPRDLSTMEYPEFNAAYRSVVAASVGMLRQDRFAAVLVGEVRERDDDGYYVGEYGFVVDTIQAFVDAGMRFYGFGVLELMIGSLSLRVSQGFNRSRKLGNNVQFFLVFGKGKPKVATGSLESV
jgi:hypothetical protein